MLCARMRENRFGTCVRGWRWLPPGDFLRLITCGFFHFLSMCGLTCVSCIYILYSHNKYLRFIGFLKAIYIHGFPDSALSRGLMSRAVFKLRRKKLPHITFFSQLKHLQSFVVIFATMIQREKKRRARLSCNIRDFEFVAIRAYIYIEWFNITPWLCVYNTLRDVLVYCLYLRRGIYYTPCFPARLLYELRARLVCSRCLFAISRYFAVYLPVGIHIFPVIITTYLFNLRVSIILIICSGI